MAFSKYTTIEMLQMINLVHYLTIRKSIVLEIIWSLSD